MYRRLFTIIFLALAGSGCAAAESVELPGPLVSVTWLQEHLAEVNVLDVRDDPAGFIVAPVFVTVDGTRKLETAGGHVPGALFLDFANARTSRAVEGHEVKWMLPGPAQFQSVLRAAGVQSARPTVIVTAGESGSDLDMAARIYWSMKIFGDDRVAILDGGLRAWLASGQAWSIEPATGDAGDWTVGEFRGALFADSEAVAKAANAHRQLLDARPLASFLGLEWKPSAGAPGHIAGARDFPPDARARSRDGSMHFLTREEYAGIFDYLGIDAAQPSTTYCNTGHMAAGAWFVLSEIMQNPDVSLYDGSMHEWVGEKRPVVTVP